MYIVEKDKDFYENIVLKDTESDITVKITPEKGGMITSIVKNGREYIYIDDKTYGNPGRGHCAVPVLFPALARTKDEAVTFDGQKYKMEKHGLVHSCKWDIIETDTSNSASATISVKSNEETKKSYPFEFEVRLKFSVKGNSVTIAQEYINCSDKLMPFTFGFHPYFTVSSLDNLEFDLNAKQVLDVTDNKEIYKPFNGDIDVDLVTGIGAIYTDTKNYTSFTDKKDNISVTVRYDENFKYVVLWSNMPDKFICVEPWSSIPNALNTGVDVTKLEPHTSLKAVYSIDIK